METKIQDICSPRLSPTLIKNTQADVITIQDTKLNKQQNTKIFLSSHISEETALTNKEEASKLTSKTTSVSLNLIHQTL